MWRFPHVLRAGYSRSRILTGDKVSVVTEVRALASLLVAAWTDGYVQRSFMAEIRD
jgi:hypothetical protein